MTDCFYLLSVMKGGLCAPLFLLSCQKEQRRARWKRKNAFSGFQERFFGFNSVLVWNWLSPHPRSAAYAVRLSLPSMDPRARRKHLLSSSTKTAETAVRSRCSPVLLPARAWGFQRGNPFGALFFPIFSRVRENGAAGGVRATIWVEGRTLRFCRRTTERPPYPKDRISSFAGETVGNVGAERKKKEENKKSLTTAKSGI